MMNRVAIVGCGAIAVGARGRGLSGMSRIHDETHVSVLLGRTDFRILALVDLDLGIAQRVASELGALAYPSVAAMRDAGCLPDVVVCAVPAAMQIETLRDIASIGARTVISEKPLGLSSDQAREIVAMFEAKRIGLIVNYQRRFHPITRQFEQEIASQRFGRLETIVATYSRGLFNNGVHVIDFLCQIAGPGRVLRAARSSGSGARSPMGDELSLSVDFDLELNMCENVHVLSIPAIGMSVWEVQLFFSDGVIYLMSGGRSIASARGESTTVLRGSTRTARVELETVSDLGSLGFVYDAVVAGLDADPRFNWSGRAAVRTLEIAEQAQNLSQQ